MILVFGICGFFLILIAQKELEWRFRFVELPATIAGIEQQCADGGGGRVRYVDCGEALPGADRRTTLELRYISPADHQEHEGRIRCDTEAEKTPELGVGQQVTILAHKSDAGRIDMRRCTAIAGPDDRR